MKNFLSAKWIFAFVVVVSVFLLVDSAQAQSAPSLIEPSLQVDIPTITFSDAKIEGDVLKINYLGDYIAGLYKYLLGASTVIAVVMIMVGGLQWTFGGTSKEAIGKAQTRIKNAVTGLVLLLGTYLILFTINPNLIKLQFPELENIDYEPLIKDSGDLAGAVTLDTIESIGIVCAGSDESGDVAAIAKSFVGKTTYRFGGKGTSPPYDGEGDRKAPDGQYYAHFCPEGTVCLDCSGFVDALAQCAGLSPVAGQGGGTASIFASADSIIECGDDYVSTETESFELAEGDLVGYKPGDREDQPKFGHVWMYIGDGKVMSSMGGESGRQAGAAVQIQSLKSICEDYPLRFVDRE